MDWRNEESDHSSVENLKWDENDAVIRTKDVATQTHDVCSKGVQAGTGICKEISNFTFALKNLDLETNDKDHVEFRTSEAQTDYDSIPVFKTREISTFQVVVQGPEILNFQGTRYSPFDIAPYWKKDSRMWLWKSVRLARKIRRTKAKAIAPASTLYQEESS